MREEHIIKQLNSLRGIIPDSDFANSSKLRIMHQAPQRPGGILMMAQGLSASLSIGLIMVFFVFMAVLGVSSLRSPLSPTFEGVSGDLAIEADNVNTTIDIRLEEVQYVADVAAKTLAKSNQSSASDSSDEKIDNMLDEAINL
jgi:hypothetical protein